MYRCLVFWSGGSSWPKWSRFTAVRVCGGYIVSRMAFGRRGVVRVAVGVAERSVICALPMARWGRSKRSFATPFDECSDGANVVAGR